MPRRRRKAVLPEAARAAPRRRQARENSAGRRRAQRESQRAPVEFDLGPSRHVTPDLQRDRPFDRRQAPAGRHQPQHCAHHCQHHVLRHQLPHNPPASGAQRGAHRYLPPAAGGARELQVGHIHATDQQHEHRCARQHHRVHRKVVAQHGAVQRPCHEPPRLIGGRVFLLHPRPHGIQFARQVAQGASRLQPSRGFENRGGPRMPLLRRQGHGLPQVPPTARKLEPRRHHSHHRAISSVYPHRAPHNARVGAEMVAPQVVTDHHHPVAPGLVLARLEAAPH